MSGVGQFDRECREIFLTLRGSSQKTLFRVAYDATITPIERIGAVLKGTLAAESIDESECREIVRNFISVL